MKNDPVYIRLSKGDELRSRNQVTRSAWESAYSHVFTHEEITDLFEGRVKQSGTWYENYVKGLSSWVAEWNGTLVGTSSLRLCTNEDAELRTLYVLPAHQGRGIGLRLWNANLETSRSEECPGMRVWVLEKAASVEFYKKRGCTLIEHGIFRVGEHAEPALCFRVGL